MCLFIVLYLLIFSVNDYEFVHVVLSCMMSKAYLISQIFRVKLFCIACKNYLKILVFSTPNPLSVSFSIVWFVKYEVSWN